MRNTRCALLWTLDPVLILTLHHSPSSCEQKKVRGASLIQQHERASAAKDAEKAAQGEQDEPPAFWDRDRDMGLGGRLMDDKTRNKFISEARGLGDRFGSGKSGGFL